MLLCTRKTHSTHAQGPLAALRQKSPFPRRRRHSAHAQRPRCPRPPSEASSPPRPSPPPQEETERRPPSAGPVRRSARRPAWCRTRAARRPARSPGPPRSPPAKKAEARRPPARPSLFSPPGLVARRRRGERARLGRAEPGTGVAAAAGPREARAGQASRARSLAPSRRGPRLRLPYPSPFSPSAPMWLQQRLKGLPGLLSSSWARRLLGLLVFALVASWYLGGAWRRLLPWRAGRPAGGAAGLCLQAETRAWQAWAEKGEARLLRLEPGGPGEAPLALVGNGHLLLDLAANQLWVAPAPGRASPVVAPSPAHSTDYPALAQLRAPASAQAQAGAAVAVLRDGAVHRVRCVHDGAARECVAVREEVVAHRGRPHLYLQRLAIVNPTERQVAFEVSGPLSGASSSGGKFVTTLEKAGDRQFLLSSGRVLQPDSAKVVLVVVAAKKLVSRVQVAPKSQFDETLVSVVLTSEPIEAARLDDTFSRLREAAKREMLEVLRLRVEDLLQEHRKAWADLFISGVEMRKITDAHTPSSQTVNMTLYYVLSTTPAPLLDPLISSEEKEKMEATLNYADHCFSGHATMHAENLWPAHLLSVPQVLQLSDLWKLTLQKRGCKGLLAAGAHGVMQGMVLSFGGLQFTENHLQFQADPDVLHNSYSLRGIHYNKDSINLAVLLDTDGKPFLHVSVKFQEKPVQLYACEGGCSNEPVELTAELRGHTFPVMVTQPITPLLYISTDLVHLQDLRHTLHLKAILAHEEHMAKQYPGLPFLFWFSVASLITLFHLFLFKLIYNEYCGPGAKPLFRSKV